MKILMLTPYLPYPPSSGGQVRTFNLLKYLSKNNEITLISLYKTEAEKKNLNKLKPFCKKIYACKRAEKPWQLKNIFRAIFSDQPFLIVRNYSDEARIIIEKLLNKENYDVIHAETFYVMPHIPQTKIPILLVEQTIEYKVYQHFVDSQSFFLRPIFNLDIKKLIHWERYYWRKANLVAAMSLVDKRKIHELEKGIRVEIVPNGAGEDMMEIPLKSRNLKKPILLFVGNFSWLQNVEAANYLINKIFPKVRLLFEQIKLVIAGQNISQKISVKQNRRIEIVRIDPDDIYSVQKLYRQATLFVAPIFGPGGTRLKLLASMAAGLPIVSTRTGVQGLDLKENQEVIIAENENQFAKKIRQILLNQKLFRKIQKNAYSLVRQKYNWEKIAQKLEKVYYQLKQS